MEPNNAECAHAREHLAAWLGDQLPEAERLQVAAHLAHCPACQQELAAYRQLWQALGHLTPPKPSEQVRPRFYAMLAGFEAEAQRPPWLAQLRQLWQQLVAPSPALRLAYSVLLLVAGLAIGYGLHSRPGYQPDASGQVAATPPEQAPPNEQQLVLALLKNPSATQRLRAVGQTKEIAQANEAVVTALLSTLNHDPNVNVRLATLDALAQLGQDPVVRQGLVRSLTRQESPLVQSALADVMVQLQMPRSVQPLRQLLRQPDLNETVKTKIERSINTLSTGQPTDHSAPSSHESLPQPDPSSGDTMAT